MSPTGAYCAGPMVIDVESWCCFAGAGAPRLLYGSFWKSWLLTHLFISIFSASHQNVPWNRRSSGKTQSVLFPRKGWSLAIALTMILLWMTFECHDEQEQMLGKPWCVPMSMSWCCPITVIMLQPRNVSSERDVWLSCDLKQEISMLLPERL